MPETELIFDPLSFVNDIDTSQLNPTQWWEKIEDKITKIGWKPDDLIPPGMDPDKWLANLGDLRKATDEQLNNPKKWFEKAHETMKEPKYWLDALPPEFQKDPSKWIDEIDDNMDDVVTVRKFLRNLPNTLKEAKNPKELMQKIINKLPADVKNGAFLKEIVEQLPIDFDDPNFITNTLEKICPEIKVVTDVIKPFEKNLYKNVRQTVEEMPGLLSECMDYNVYSCIKIAKSLSPKRLILQTLIDCIEGEFLIVNFL